MALLGMASCSKDLAIEEEASTEGTSTSASSATGNNTLTVRTRSISTVDGEVPAVSLPVNVYAFNTSGQCVALQTIDQDGGTVSFKFKRGNYNLYATAGATAEAYDLPTQANANAEAAITLKEGQSHGELMLGAAAVKITDGEDNTLTLAMKRKVMQVESVSINNVPSTVTGVSITLAPLYAGIKLKGEYTGETGSHTMALTQTAPGTWQLPTPQYSLEASSGEATITVQMTTGSDTKSYAYYSNDELKANYKISITGTYNSNEFDLNGTISGEDWAGTKDIAFTFADEEVETPDNPDTPSNPVDDELIGTLYASNKGFVVSASKNADGSKTYLLMSTKELKTSCGSTGISQEEAEELISTNIRTLSGISKSTGWRLPTKEELIAFKDLYSTYQKLSNKDSFTYGPSTSYFYQKDEDTIAALHLQGETDKDPMKGTIYIRAFTTVTVAK